MQLHGVKKLVDLKAIVASKPKKKLVLAAAQDQHSLAAVIRAWKDDIIEPIFIGDKEAIQNLCVESGYNITGFRIIHEPEIDKAVEMAVRMVSTKQADILMKGKVGTSSF